MCESESEGEGEVKGEVEGEVKSEGEGEGWRGREHHSGNSEAAGVSGAECHLRVEREVAHATDPEGEVVVAKPRAVALNVGGGGSLPDIVVAGL